MVFHSLGPHGQIWLSTSDLWNVKLLLVITAQSSDAGLLRIAGLSSAPYSMPPLLIRPRGRGVVEWRPHQHSYYSTSAHSCLGHCTARAGRAPAIF
jgi:hypothetical protein